MTARFNLNEMQLLGYEKSATNEFSNNNKTRCASPACITGAMGNSSGTAAAIETTGVAVLGCAAIIGYDRGRSPRAKPSRGIAAVTR
jgi:hypothetical protein